MAHSPQNRGRHVVQLLHGTSSRLFQLLSSAGDSVPLSRSVLHDNDDRSIQPFADGVVLDLGFVCTAVAHGI